MLLKLQNVCRSSPMTITEQNYEACVNLVILAKATSWQCRFNFGYEIFEFQSFGVSSINQQKINKEIYKFEAPIKTKFCINLVYPSFGHVRTAKLTCEGTPGCAQSQRYPASKANAAGLLCRAMEKFFLLKARNSSEKPACTKWKYRQIIVAHHPSFGGNNEARRLFWSIFGSLRAA